MLYTFDWIEYIKIYLVTVTLRNGSGCESKLVAGATSLIFLVGGRLN